MNLKSILTLSFCMLLALSVSAQKKQNIVKAVKNAQGIEVTYQSSYKGRVSPGGMIMKVSGDQVALSRIQGQHPQQAQQTNSGSPVQKQPKTFNYMDYGKSETYRVAELPSGKVISSVTPFTVGEGFKEVVGEETILGLKCTIIRAIVNSNTIDISYTQDIPFRGTPQASVGVPDGLVLKIVRNGDSVQEATDLKAVKEAADLLPTSMGETMVYDEYLYEIDNANVITVNVFDQDRISFTGAKLPEGELKSNTLYQAGGGTIIMKKVKLPDYTADRSIYCEVIQYSDGDAYDRTGSVFVVPTDKEQSFLDAMRDLDKTPSFRANNGVDYHGLVSTPTYTAPLEIMRFFTGFGVRAYNGARSVRGQVWVDSVNYKMQVTSFASELKGEVWVGAYIGNWDAKGHKVSVKLKYHPDGGSNVHKVVPLFNTVNYLEQAGQPYPVFMLDDKLNAKFTATEKMENVMLYYMTTGHGGWGNGDEFNQKINTIYLDGKKVSSFIPWRDDCATYRNNNPCSGNASNGETSSDYSRSNWCPGTVTNPEYIYLGDIEPGEHTITVEIPQGAPEGGSNSYWCLSGSLIY